MRKIVLIGITLFLITGLSGCLNSESVEPTPAEPIKVDEFKNWITYENETLGYAVKVPNGSKIYEHLKETEIDNSSDEFYGQWSFMVFENEGDQSLNDFIVEYWDKESCVPSRSDLTLAGVNGEEFDYTCTVSGLAHVVVLENEDYFYAIDSGDTQNLSIFEKILTTFEFIEKSESIGTKPEITSPENEGTAEGPVITINGKATPGYLVEAHNNYTKKEMECVTTNDGIPDGTPAIADADGNFEIRLAGACQRDMEVFVSAVHKAQRGLCLKQERLSKKLNFTITGELHGVCNM